MMEMKMKIMYQFIRDMIRDGEPGNKALLTSSLERCTRR